eukprot:COSAG02_NODE_1624_length_11594_cov_6.314833_5_plen_272_part_00
MWGAEKDDDAAFERRLDSVVREIGERGKLMLPEAVTPLRESTPAPTPSLDPTPAPAPSCHVQAQTPAPAPTSTPLRSPATSLPPAAVSVDTQHQNTSPSLLSSRPLEQPPTAVQHGHAGGGAVMDVSTFLDLVDRMQAKADEEKSELKVEMEAKMEAQRHQMEANMEALRRTVEQQREERKTTDAKTCVSETQLQALQERFDALVQAKLLTDDEVAKLEDLVADFIGCRASSTMALVEIGAVAEDIEKLVGMCEGMSKDAMLARQLRRKFL